MSRMPSSRQSNNSFLSYYFTRKPYTSSSSSSSPPPNPTLSIFFFLIALLLASPPAGANHEVSLLYSWLHSSTPPKPLPPHFSSWDIRDPTPCNWASITCSPQGSVTEINIHSLPIHLPLPSNLSSLLFLSKLRISDANLTGTVPSELGDCTALKVIDLSSNGLVGPVPRTLGRLQNLEDLIMNSNQLTGKIPPELGDCKSLKNLLLFDNHFSENIPAQLGKLSNLLVLRAGGNKEITGEIPYQLGDCSNLTVLGLADTQISGSLPPELGKLSKLQTLSIYTTMLSGEIPHELGNCSELVNLYLYENSLSGSIPPELGKLGKLEKLLLWQNSLVGSIPEEIGNSSRLRVIDLSLNSLSGTMPSSLGNLSELEELMISTNNVSGSIPSSISNATNLLQLQLDTNQISGLIPPEIGNLRKLMVFLAWANRFEGSIPSTLADCRNLQALDLSHNSLTGSIPSGLFQLKNLTKLLLISNHISGSLPPGMGNCSSLVRLRLGNNRIAGEIPGEIGGLRSLNFLDLSRNRLSGLIPDELGGCRELQMVDLRENSLVGPIPNLFTSLSSLQVLDVSENRLTGPIPASLGGLVSLSKLILSKNMFSGSIPSSLGLCSSLQLLDLSSNRLFGNIPVELCEIDALEIALNLSWNELTGPVPVQISALNKLSVLDLSHNKFQGKLSPLAGLINLVSLNISYNNFTGYLPDDKLFRQLSGTELAGNEALCSSGLDSCFINNGIRTESDLSKTQNDQRRSRRFKLALSILITMTLSMVAMGIVLAIRACRSISNGDDSELGEPWPWHFTPFQKKSFTVEEVLRCLVDSNVIGKGCSGTVYRARMETGEVIAVKKLWPSTRVGGDGGGDGKSEIRDSFSTEVKTLGSIRHKNIVRFLGCCWNRSTRLLMYDYMPNGSLGSLLHERTARRALEWELRFRILLGAARGLAYLHHDCVPPIVHRDIKANNILVGLDFEPYIADFGLAKLVDDGDFGRSSNTVAGSYGYIAPEYGYMMKITEKSDVYSYGVVVLEVLTGKQPIDPTIPEALHVVDWVRKRRGGIEVIDPSLLPRPDPEIEEMRQALGVALLCVSSSPDDRPTMKDVEAMLKGIRQEREDHATKVGAGLQIKASPPADFLGDKTTPGSGGVSASSSAVAGRCLYPKCSSNTSFSGSSLLHSSSNPNWGM